MFDASKTLKPSHRAGVFHALSSIFFKTAVHYNTARGADFFRKFIQKYFSTTTERYDAPRMQ